MGTHLPALETLGALRDAVLARRRFLAVLGLAAGAGAGVRTNATRDDSDDLRAAARLLGLPLTDAQCEQAERLVAVQRDQLAGLRSVALAWDTNPAFVFDPTAIGATGRPGAGRIQVLPAKTADLDPEDDTALAFASVAELGRALRAGKVTSVRLTELALARLAAHDATLHCVVTPLREQALAAAVRADEELAAGRDRGPLHGIPYGAKDLFAWPGAPTTFGAKPLQAQDLGELTATALDRLQQAGAVLVAKLALGALAMGDVWFGGRTRNPWRPEQGSSGSSAGSASAVAAGLVPFALGTETNGSILSPAARCGVTALRPSFGHVPRGGALPLCWTMDKIGVLARGAEDAAIVHGVLAGPDPSDPAARASGYEWPAPPRTARFDFQGRRIARLRGRWSDEQEAFVQWAKGRGATIVDFEPPTTGMDQVGNLIRAVLLTEASAACDRLLLSGQFADLTRQDDDAWPNLLRSARIVPAADYLQGMRVRTGLIEAMDEAMGRVDLVVGAGRGGGMLTPTNFTGHPCVVVPVGQGRAGETPAVVTLFGHVDADAALLAVAAGWQAETEWHRQRPEGFA